jgi:large subunit ribosomal protein L3
MAKGHRPRHGSLAFYPRKRAKRIYPNVKVIKQSDEFTIPFFACYKAGMTRVVAVNNYEMSPSYGQKISIPVTIMECPPLFVFGIRAYRKSKAVSQIFADKLDKDLKRKFTLPKKNKGNIKKIETALTDVDEFRLLVHSQPKKIKMKKKPEVIELIVTGKNNEEVWKKCQELLGKEIKASDVFQKGDYIDAIGITKGKGTQGPVKRFGIRIQTRKAHGHRRFPGSIGAWTPSRVLHTVPMAGQLGYQRRTEYNKRILKVSEEALKIEGGIPHYGEIKGDYVLVQGSVPGPKKRFIILRHAVRNKTKQPKLDLEMISTEGQTR